MSVAGRLGLSHPLPGERVSCSVENLASLSEEILLFLIICAMY